MIILLTASLVAFASSKPDAFAGYDRARNEAGFSSNNSESTSNIGKTLNRDRRANDLRNMGLLDPEVADQLEGNGWQDTIPGTPGEDYPNLDGIPDTSFSCEDKTPGGYYADVETKCQVFHVCNVGAAKSSFLCPEGSIFNQKYFVCDWWYDFECSDAPSLYNMNDKANPGSTAQNKSEDGFPRGKAEVLKEGGNNFNEGFDLFSASTGEGGPKYVGGNYRGGGSRTNVLRNNYGKSAGPTSDDQANLSDFQKNVRAKSDISKSSSEIRNNGDRNSVISENFNYLSPTGKINVDKNVPITGNVRNFPSKENDQNIVKNNGNCNFAHEQGNVYDNERRKDDERIEGNNFDQSQQEFSQYLPPPEKARFNFDNTPTGFSSNRNPLNSERNGGNSHDDRFLENKIQPYDRYLNSFGKGNEQNTREGTSNVNDGTDRRRIFDAAVNGSNEGQNGRKANDCGTSLKNFEKQRNQPKSWWKPTSARPGITYLNPSSRQDASASPSPDNAGVLFDDGRGAQPSERPRAFSTGGSDAVGSPAPGAVKKLSSTWKDGHSKTPRRLGVPRSTGGLRGGFGNGYPGANKQLPGSEAIAGTVEPDRVSGLDYENSKANYNRGGSGSSSGSSENPARNDATTSQEFDSRVRTDYPSVRPSTNTDGVPSDRETTSSAMESLLRSLGRGCGFPKVNYRPGNPRRPPGSPEIASGYAAGPLPLDFNEGTGYSGVRPSSNTNGVLGGQGRTFLATETPSGSRKPGWITSYSVSRDNGTGLGVIGMSFNDGDHFGIRDQASRDSGRDLRGYLPPRGIPSVSSSMDKRDPPQSRRFNDRYENARREGGSNLVGGVQPQERRYLPVL